MFTFFSITIRSFLIHTAARSWAQTSNWIPTEPWSHHHAVRLDYIKTQKNCTGSPRCSKTSSTLNKVQTETEIRLKPRLDHSHQGAGLDVIEHQSHLFSVLELFVSLVTETRTWWGAGNLLVDARPLFGLLLEILSSFCFLLFIGFSLAQRRASLSIFCSACSALQCLLHFTLFSPSLLIFLCFPALINFQCYIMRIKCCDNREKLFGIYTYIYIFLWEPFMSSLMDIWFWSISSDLFELP